LEVRATTLQHEDVRNVVGDDARLDGCAQFWPPLRVGQLHQPILYRADRAFAPRRRVVPQVPVLEGEGEALLEHQTLTVDSDTAFVAALKPPQLFAEAFRIGVVDQHDV